MLDKAKKAAAARAYYKTHREAILAQQKAPYAAHKEERLAHGKVYREDHKEECDARGKAYREVHREERAAKSRAYYAVHKEECTARNKLYEENHKEQSLKRRLFWAKEHPERIKVASAKYNKTQQGLLTHASAQRAQRQKWPERVKARELTNSAIESGKLVKGLCAVCGIEQVNAHHDDYSKPLEVVWLCEKHHRMTHGMLR